MLGSSAFTVYACDVPIGAAQAADTVIGRTNTLRAAQGLAPVHASAALTDAARKHACTMASLRTISHIGDGGTSVAQRVEAEGYVWGFVAENVASGYDTPEWVTEGWWTSQGHRENMLADQAREIGIGWARSGDTDYWVMVLAAPPQG